VDGAAPARAGPASAGARHPSVPNPADSGAPATIPESTLRQRFGADWQKYQGLYAKASPEDRAVLKKVVDGPNAAAAWEAFHRVTTGAGTRNVPGHVARSLTLAVGTPRVAGTQNGQPGVMGVHQAVRAAETYAALPEARRTEFGHLLSNAGKPTAANPGTGADAETERALLFKALAARKTELAKPGGADAAMKEVSWFAGEIRGMKRERLVQHTSPQDVDETRNDRSFDPGTLTNRDPKDRTLVHDRSARQRQQDQDANDGRYQHYTVSCVPASADVVRAEADPVHALKTRRDLEGQPGGSTATAAATRERKVLDHHNVARVTRQGEVASTRILELAATGTSKPPTDKHHVTQEEYGALKGWLDGHGAAATPKAPTPAWRAWKKVFEAEKAQGRRFPLEPDLRAAREFGTAPTQDAQGKARNPAMPRADVAKVLNGLETTTGVTYQEIKAGQVRLDGDRPESSAYDTAEANLRQGIPVVLSAQFLPAGNGGHVMTMTAVRGSSPNRSFLVHDTLSGKTAWVTEQSLKDASFGRTFGLNLAIPERFWVRKEPAPAG
jgi:hypothetical protein